MNDFDSKPKRPSRPFFSFRLRTLLLVITLVAIPLGYVMYERHRCRQQQLANTLWMSEPTYSPHVQGEIRIDLGDVETDSSISVRSGWTSDLLGDNSGDQIVSFRRSFENEAHRFVTYRQMHAISHLPNLKVLELRDCDVEDPGLSRVAAFRDLESLSLQGSSVSDNDLRHFARLLHLRSLSLNNTKIGDSGIIHLARLPRLRHLDLHQTRIGDEGVEHLSLLTQLHYLDLSDTLVTDKSLLRLYGFKKLYLLALPPDAFSIESRALLRKSLPDCDIVFAKN